MMREEEATGRGGGALRGVIARRECDTERDTTQLAERRAGGGDRCQRRVDGVHGVAEARELAQPEAIAAGGRHRETARRHDHGVGVDRRRAVAFHAPATIERTEAGDGGAHAQRRAGAGRVREQSVAHVARLVRPREQLRRLDFLGEGQTELVLEERDLLSQRPRAEHPVQQIGRRIRDEARFVDVHRQHVAASAAADEDLAAAVAGPLEERGLRAALRGKDRGHGASGAGTDDDDAPGHAWCERRHGAS
jgi:hypothetical protein